MGEHELSMARRLYEGVADVPGVTVYGDWPALELGEASAHGRRGAERLGPGLCRGVRRPHGGLGHRDAPRRPLHPAHAPRARASCASPPAGSPRPRRSTWPSAPSERSRRGSSVLCRLRLWDFSFPSRLKNHSQRRSLPIVMCGRLWSVSRFVAARTCHFAIGGG